MGAQRVGVIAVLLVVGSAPAYLGEAAHAAGSRPGSETLVELLQPQRGQAIPASGSTVLIRTRAGVVVTARIGRRDVTRALRLRSTTRRGRTILRGRLSRRLVRGAPRVLRVAGRRGGRVDTDFALVQAMRHRRGFLSVRLRRTGRRTAPVDAILRTRAHRIWLRVTLNGRRIERRSTSRRLGVRRLRLTAAEGLRHGRNVLVVAASDARGRGDVVRRVLRLPRRGVIPGVRAPRSARVRAAVHLDAGPTLRGRRGGKLVYRWRVTRRPRGSRARLLGAHRRVARFRPDRRGRYAVRLMVSQPSPRRSPIASASAAGASLTTAVEAQPSIPAYGLRFHTDLSTGLTVAGANVPMPAAPGAMLVAAIDETTGAVTESVAVAPTASGDRDIGTLLDAIDALGDPTQLVAAIGSPGPTNVQYWPPGASFARDNYLGLYATLATLGLDASTEAAQTIATGGAFSILGSPGDAPGAATANIDASSSAAGVLDGWLRLTGLSDALTGTLVLEQPDFIKFEFDGAANPALITAPDPPPGVQPTQPLDPPLLSGDVMGVAVFDAQTLTQVASAKGNVGGDNGVLTPVTQVLQQYVADPSKLILFKMRGTIAWENTRLDLSPISQMLASIGSNRDIFLRSLSYNAPNTAPDYIFFGGAGVDAVEGSVQIAANAPGGGQAPVSSPNLGGTLHRDELGRWAPSAATSSDAVTQDLQAIAVQPPSAYSYPSKPAGTDAQYAAAEAQLFQLIVSAGALCDPGPSCAVPQGVRANYGNQELLDEIDTAISGISCGGTVDAPSGASYSQKQLNALQDEVCGELAKLKTVHQKLFAPLQDQVYAALQTDESLDLLSASDDYLAWLQEERDEQLAKQHDFLGISGEAGDILGDLVDGAMSIAEYMLAPETGGASVLAGQLTGELFTLTGDTLGLASAAKGVGESADKVAPSMITVGSLFSYVQSSYGYASDRLEEVEGLITTDPAKLSQVEANVANGEWDLLQQVNNGHQAYEVITFQQLLAAQQYMLPRMISAVAKPCDVGGSAGDPTTYEAFTALREFVPPGNYLRSQTSRLRSAHLTSSDAALLGSQLFGPPFQQGTDPIAQGPAGAAIAQSPFFMLQIAPTSISTSADCTEHFIP